MKHVMLLALGLAVACVACAEPPEVAETGGSIEIKGDAYVAVISKSEGGALASLKSRDGKVAFLSDLRIYTDHGLYVERGYVGTKGESQPK